MMLESISSFLEADGAVLKMFLGVLSVVLVRAVLERLRWIQIMNRIPGPPLGFSNTEWVHPFLAHFYPLVLSVGSIPQCPDLPNALWWYLKLGKTYADYGMCRVWAFHPYWVPFARSATFVFDPDIAKQLLEDRQTTRKLVKAQRIYDIVQPIVGQSLLGLPDGPEWKHQRKLAAASFSQQIVEQVCQISVELLETQVFPSWQEGRAVEGISFSSRLALEILGHTAFGYAFGGLKQEETTKGNKDDEEEEESLYDCYLDMLRYLTKKARSPPYVHHLWWNENVQFQKRSERLNQLIGDIVQRRLKDQVESEQRQKESILRGSSASTSADSSETKAMDLLDYLVKKDDDGNRLPFDYIFGNVRMFFFAGHDTTSSTLANGLWHLGTNPDKQRRLQEEVDELYKSLSRNGGGEEGSATTPYPPSHKQLNQLRYLDAVVRECLRLYSPGLVGRTCTEPVQLTGRDGRTYTFPTGASLFVMPFVGHMTYWENAERFEPERFLVTSTNNDGGGTNNGTTKSSSASTTPWYPFSVGARNCVGKPMAVAELKALVAHIVHNYSIRPQENAEPPINTLLLTVKPHDVSIFVERRRNN
jgi:cytochrome P450